MDYNNMSPDELIKEIEVLREQNEKLKITSDFYKMKYEDDMQKLKHDTDVMFKEIADIGVYKNHYKFKMVSVTTDAVVFGFDSKKKELQLLLIKRGSDPKEYSGYWALPGGFLQQNARKELGEKDETLEQCALRELEEETSFKSITRLEQFHVYSDPDRDSRGRVITVAFLALVILNKDDGRDSKDVKGGTDAEDARWFPVDELPQDIAFDHRKIISDAREALRRNVYFKPVVYELLDDKFTMSELQNLYEIILGTEFDRRNFKKKIKGQGFLKCTSDDSEDDMHKGKQQYVFDNDAYDEFKENGFKLEF